MKKHWQAFFALSILIWILGLTFHLKSSILALPEKASPAGHALVQDFFSKLFVTLSNWEIDAKVCLKNGFLPVESLTQDSLEVKNIVATKNLSKPIHVSDSLYFAGEKSFKIGDTLMFCPESGSILKSHITAVYPSKTQTKVEVQFLSKNVTTLPKSLIVVSKTIRLQAEQSQLFKVERDTKNLLISGLKGFAYDLIQDEFTLRLKIKLSLAELYSENYSLRLKENI